MGILLPNLINAQANFKNKNDDKCIIHDDLKKDKRRKNLYGHWSMVRLTKLFQHVHVHKNWPIHLHMQHPSNSVSFTSSQKEDILAYA